MQRTVQRTVQCTVQCAVCSVQCSVQRSVQCSVQCAVQCAVDTGRADAPCRTQIWLSGVKGEGMSTEQGRNSFSNSGKLQLGMLTYTAHMYEGGKQQL